MDEAKLKDFNNALVGAFSHFRDLSVRDGIQSLYANKAPIRHILPIVEELKKWQESITKAGGVRPPVEVWGGGQFAQPAKFLGEDPFINLKEITKAASDKKGNLVMDLQCLYRGRQGYGFYPISAEVQEKAIAATADRGIKVFRIFDMMNDIDNLKPGFKAMKDYNDNHLNKITIEGAISYISEPEGSKRVWELEEYGTYAVELAKLGANEIAIKDYAGVGDKEMLKLIGTIREELKKAGFKNMPINVHSHGKKPELLVNAIEEAGAAKVDTAFKGLSNGASHSDIMDVLTAFLKKRGYNVAEGGEFHDAFEKHKIVKQMREVEKVIATKSAQFGLKPMTGLTTEQVNSYRMAGGALSDLTNNYLPDNDAKYKPDGTVEKESTFAGMRKAWIGTRAKTSTPNPGYNAIPNIPGTQSPIPVTQSQWIVQVLQECPKLWEQAGRFNTVTPGAFILCKQAVGILDKKLRNKDIRMTDYTNEYLDLVIGRYGRNKGMEKGIGDLNFRNAALMFRALEQINHAVKKSEMSPEQSIPLITMALGVGKDQSGLWIHKDGQVSLDNPALERRLRRADIEAFKAAVEKADLIPEVSDDIIKAMTEGRSPELKDGLKAGEKIIAGIDTEAAREKGARVSDRETCQLMALLLREKNKFGQPDDSKAIKLFNNLAGQSHEQGHKSAIDPAAVKQSSLLRGYRT